MGRRRNKDGVLPEGIYRFIPANRAQADFLSASEKVVAYIGGLGSGKTHVGAFWSVTRMLMYPQACGLIAANSYKQLESATLPKVFGFLEAMRIPFYYNQQTKVLRLKLAGVKGKVYCRSLSEFQDLRGTEFLWIWLDETRDTSEEAFRVILGRLRQRVDMQSGPISLTGGQSKGQQLAPNQLRITTTPDMLKCRWLYNYLHHPEMRQRLADLEITVREIKASSRDNPHLGSDYLALLEGSYDSELARQEIDGEWVIIPDGKPVFGSVFEPRLHLGAFAFNPNKPLIIGLDWGYHYPAAVFCQEDSQDRWVVLGELLERDQETGEFCESIWRYIQRRFPDVPSLEVYCDPAGRQRTSKSRRSDIEIAREYKLYPICRSSQILDGIAIMRRKLSRLIGGLPGMLIDEIHCPLLVEGFRGGYHYPKRGEGPEDSTPYKDGTYDHLFDALRYIAVNRYHVLGSPHGVSYSVYEPIDPVTGY